MRAAPTTRDEMMAGFKRRQLGKVFGSTAVVLVTGSAAFSDAITALVDLLYPRGFEWRWAPYLIEGVTAKDGLGQTNWRELSHMPGRVANCDTCDVACDSYHHYAEGTRSLRNMWAKACRIPVAWSRIFTVRRLTLAAPDRKTIR